MLGKHNLVSSLLKELGARGDAKGFGFGTLKAKGGVAEVLSPEEEAKRLARREKLVREMVDTEKSYVSQLEALDECYMTPLIKEAAKPEPPLTLKMCDVLFLNVRSIKSMNETTLLTALEKALTTPNQCIGQALIDFAPFFQLYKDYIANHVKANDLLEQLNAEDSPHVKFKAFCATALADPKAKSLSLASLLITPIQRVPRYKMLLDEIRKNTPPSHADVSSLDKAYALVSQAAIDINEAVRSQENRTFLMDMQENMFTTKMVLVKPGPMSADRVFIRKGLLTKVCRSSDKPFTFFLFSNMLMYGVEVRMNLKEKYKISHQLPIDGHFQVERNDQPNSKGAPPKWSLKIVNNVKSFVVYAKDEAEYESWFKDLQKCVAVLRAEQKAGGETGGVKPIWISDKDSKACTLCHTDFTVIRRRHHCRKCGTLCCGDCSKARIDIKVVLNPGTPPPPLKKGEKVDKVRVCVSCVGIIRSLGGDVPLGIEGKGLDEKKHLDTNGSNGDIDDNGALSPRTRAPSSSVTSTMDGGTGGPPRVVMMGMGTLKMGELNRALSIRQSGGMSLNIKATRKCGQASCGQNALDRQPYCRAHTAGSSLSSAFEVPTDVTSPNGTATTEVGDIDVEQRAASTSVSRRVPPPPPGRGPPPLPSTQPPPTPTNGSAPSSSPSIGSPPATPTGSPPVKKSVPPPPKRAQTLTTPITITSSTPGSVSAPPTPTVGGSTPPNGSFLAITPTPTATTSNGSTVNSSPVSPTPPARPAKPLFSTGSMNAHAVAAALAAGSNGNTSSISTPATPTATSVPVTPSATTTPATPTAATATATVASPAAAPLTSPPTPKTTITSPPPPTSVARTPSKTVGRLPPPPPATSPAAAPPASDSATTGSYTRALPVPKSKAVVDTPVVVDDVPPPLPPPEPLDTDMVTSSTPPSAASITVDTSSTAPTPPTVSSPTPSTPSASATSATGTSSSSSSSSLPVGVPGAVTIHARPSVRTGIPPPPPPPRTANGSTVVGTSISSSTIPGPPPPRISLANGASSPPPPPPSQGSTTPKPTISRGVPPPPPAKK